MLVNRSATALNFGRLDLAAPCEQPPVLFHFIRVPCACGRSLDKPVYTFFPSSVFVHGECPSCGPRSAIFAPHMAGVAPNIPEKVESAMKRLIAEMVKTYWINPEEIIAEVLNFFAREETAAAVEKGEEDDHRGAA